MLSGAITRAFAIIVLLTLAAAVPATAQCVVRCAGPIAPPKCHHHSPGRQDTPRQVCVEAMLPGAVRLEAPVTVIASIADGAFVAAVVAERPDSRRRPDPLLHGLAPTILRI